MKKWTLILTVIIVASIGQSSMGDMAAEWNSFTTGTKISKLKTQRLFWTNLNKTLVNVQDHSMAGIFIGVPAEVLALIQFTSTKVALWEIRKGEESLFRIGQQIGGPVPSGGGLMSTAVRAAEIPVNAALKSSRFNSKLALWAFTPVAGLSIWYFLDQSAFGRWIKESGEAVTELDAQIAALELIK